MNTRGTTRQSSPRVPADASIPAPHLETSAAPPQRIDAHLQRAKQLHLNGRWNEAAAEYRQALALAPQNPIAAGGLADIAFRGGNLASAESLLQNALAAHPRFAFGHFSLARIHKARGDWDAAAEALELAVRCDPHLALAHVELAMVSEKLGRLDTAEAAYRAAVNLTPQNAQAWNGLGVLQLSQGRPRDAVDSFRQALELNPAFAQAANNLGLALDRLGDFTAAVEALETARRILPNSPDVLGNLAHAYLSADRIDDAARAVDDALKIDPQHAAALSQRGRIAMRRADPSAAVIDFRRAAELASHDADVHNNLGTALFALNRDEDAIAAFDHAIHLNPRHVEAHYNRGLAHFRGGDFDQAWPDYHWRRHRPGGANLTDRFAEWTGQSLSGKTLLIRGEQGIGDELMLASRYNDVLSAAGHCVLACERRLVPLFARSFPTATVIDAAALPTFLTGHTIDYEVLAGDLPRYSARPLGTLPPPPPYLRPDRGLVEQWRQRFAAYGEGLRIGISWRGGATAENQHRRSTQLAHWRPLFALPRTVFVNLQYGDHRGELQTLRQQFGIPVHDSPDADPLTDLDGFAAKIAALDLVISIDNSTVHMAGGLGIETWAAIPPSADWRWGRRGESTYWYRHVRLFRRSDEEDWEELFARMAGQLAESRGWTCRHGGNEV